MYQFLLLFCLFKNFAGTDAKALVSIQGLAALNIHFGGNKFTSQQAMYEYLENLTFQALSQENDKVYMSFSEVGLLVNDLLECLVKKEHEQIEKSSILGGKLRKKLETDFKAELSPELKIQKGEEIEGELIEQAESSTPLKTETIVDIYNQDKEDFLKAVTLSLSLLHNFIQLSLNSGSAKLHSTKPELKFCASSNPARGVSEIRNGEDL